MTGNRAKGFRAADKAAGITAAYRKGTWTWHHHQNCGLMQLVNMSIHSRINHTGGFSICQRGVCVHDLHRIGWIRVRWSAARCWDGAAGREYSPGSSTEELS
ncbi:HNH endonuclease [Streptomyces sp. NBC_00572]|uniref:HNH endonuclease n=1 Tax=Streptomyces sp. NBC_00572 TaxID=2903664 RepID=UPI00338F2BF3